MTDNLFIDLFAYRQRENRDPLEDWLTECLAATMRALPPIQLAQLTAYLSGLDADQIAPFSDQSQIEIHTQYNAGKAGRPDMLLLLAGKPWILFENKVGHSVGQRQNADGSQSNQLRQYGDWLKEAGADCGLKKAIVFVTHLTPPPDAFVLGSQDHYHGFERSPETWNSIARILADLVQPLGSDHHANALSNALLSYLKDKNMSYDFPDNDAFSAGHKYVKHGAKLEGLVEAMWLSAEQIADFGRLAEYNPKPNWNDGTISKCRFAKPGRTALNNWLRVETGVWFPELSSRNDDKQSALPSDGTYAFVGLFDEKQKLSHFKETPSGFKRLNGDFLAFRALSDFESKDARRRGEEIVVWVDVQAKALRTFLLEHEIVQ